VALKSRFQNDMVVAWQNGMGAVWERHGMCEWSLWKSVRVHFDT
jgi:hypothetical protein